MQELQFTDAATAERFALAEGVVQDQWLYVPNPGVPNGCYKGFLSEIPAAAAERYVAFGGNLIVRKPAEAEAVDNEEEVD